MVEAPNKKGSSAALKKKMLEAPNKKTALLLLKKKLLEVPKKTALLFLKKKLVEAPGIEPGSDRRFPHPSTCVAQPLVSSQMRRYAGSPLTISR